MRSFLLISFITAFLFSSCGQQSNEEKAKSIIEEEVKASLYKPASFELAQFQLDSCFSNDANHNATAMIVGYKVATLYKQYKETMFHVEDAERSMNIYAPDGYSSAFSKQQYKSYKAEFEKARDKADRLKSDILQVYRDNNAVFEKMFDDKREFTGWMATMSYRAETNGGQTAMGNVLYYFDKDFTNVIAKFNEHDMMDMDGFDVNDLQYDFAEELKAIFNEE